MRRVAILGTLENRTTAELLAAWHAAGADAEAMSPSRALRVLAPGDVAVARLDVASTLDGIEPGLAALVALEARGVEVVNRARPLVAVHDKLRTARILQAVGVPHPRTVLVRAPEPQALAPPFVLKPRFGSWGKDVCWCGSIDELREALAAVAGRRWFQRHGALLQEAVEPQGHDLRVLVAGGRILAGARRSAAPGEWRTNVSLGGTLEPVEVPDAAAELALTAAVLVGADLVGVDLLPLPQGGWTLLELNGAVEFDELAAADPALYERIGRVLAVLPPPRSDERRMRAAPRRVVARGTIAA
jgi:RimK family alpha-L-glutamate ligase